MAPWRVVVLREAQALGTSARLRAAVESILDRPVPELALILVANLPDRSKAKIYQRLTKEAVAVEFPQLQPAEVPDWLIAWAEERQLTLEPAAARALVSAIGPELGVLIQEMGKLREYVGDKRTMTKQDVAAVVGEVPRVNRWDWMDAVGEGRFTEARAGLGTLLDTETGVGLVIGLGSHFLRLALAARAGERALAEALPPYQRWLAARIAKQARRWTPDAIDAALDDLLRADRLLKSTSLNERQIIEELLLRMHSRAQSAAA
jgi:DNA polymerase-3 subunit delta